MADELRMALSELLRKAMIEQDAGFLREGVRVLAQALMEMEVQEHVGAGRHERTPSGRASATATGSGSGTPGWARSSCGCRGCETAATSLRCWSREGGPSGRWRRWSRRRTSRASPRAGSTSW